MYSVELVHSQYNMYSVCNMLGFGMNINRGGHTQGKGITMIYYIRFNRN